MAEFSYNNTKNTSTGHILFKLNCKYYPCVFYEEDLDSYLKSRTTEKLSFELWELITVYQQNLHHAQEFQKQAHDKSVKPQSYASSNKVWLSSKHLKTKPNCKLKTKFLSLFWVLHLVGKQVYKLELPKKWKIYDVFHVVIMWPSGFTPRRASPY